MKRLFSILLSLMILITVTACSNGDKGEIPGSGSTSDNTVSESGTQSKTPSASDTESESTEPDSQPNTDQEEKETMMNIQIGDHLLTAILVENSSTEALIELLKDGPITIDMNDYASMEKVGPFPQSLPRNDEQISTDAGDLILYQGNSFVIYYDTNSWNFTRLGKINDVTKQELRDILGSGSVTAVLSLPAES